MIDKEYVQGRAGALVKSLAAPGKDIQEEAEKLIAYLQTYSDQRKKPSEPHGLDIWAHEALGLEQKEYSDEERKLLRAEFNDVTQHVLTRTKNLLSHLFTPNNKEYIKNLLSRPLKDELKVFCCEIISRNKVKGLEAGISALFLKGTEKASLAAFNCMRDTMEIKYFFPVKELSPARLVLSADDQKRFLSSLKHEYPLIEALEEESSLGTALEYIQDPASTNQVAHVVVALPHVRQKEIYAHMKQASADTYRRLGAELESLYDSIEKPKSQEYLGKLKKAVGDSLLVGGWELKKETEKSLGRLLAARVDYDYLASILEALPKGRRIKYFTTILNPPKHIKREKDKKRLFWVYSRIQTRFKDDYRQLGKYIKWHLGNDDDEVKIETMVTIAGFEKPLAKEIVEELKRVSEDDRFRKYHNRINIVLPDEALLLNETELQTLSDEALKSKIDIILEKGQDDGLNKNAAELSDYAETVDERRFQLVAEQLDRVLNAMSGKHRSEAEDHVCEAFKRILQADDSKDTVRKKFILNHSPFLRHLRKAYPRSLKSLKGEVLYRLLENIILKEPGNCEAFQTAIELIEKTDKHIEPVLSAFATRMVREGCSLAELEKLFSGAQGAKAISHLLNYLAILKKNCDFVLKESRSETERMKAVIVKEIVPKLVRAKQRAGDQEILTHSYDQIIGVLLDYGKATAVETHRDPLCGEQTEAKHSDFGFGSDVEENQSPSLKDMLLRLKVPAQREKALKAVFERAIENDDIAILSDELSDLPGVLMDWTLYKLLENALATAKLRDYLIASEFFGVSMRMILSTMNKMLYRLYNSYKNAVEEKARARENQLDEIGRLIVEHLEKIEINLFGYYELRASLENIGLEPIADKPGSVVSKEEFDSVLHELLPSEGSGDLYQAITIGMRVKDGLVIRRAYLASKKD